MAAAMRWALERSSSALVQPSSSLVTRISHSSTAWKCSKCFTGAALFPRVTLSWRVRRRHVVPEPTQQGGRRGTPVLAVPRPGARCVRCGRRRPSRKADLRCLRPHRPGRRHSDGPVVAGSLPARHRVRRGTRGAGDGPATRLRRERGGPGGAPVGCRARFRAGPGSVRWPHGWWAVGPGVQALRPALATLATTCRCAMTNRMSAGTLATTAPAMMSG